MLAADERRSTRIEQNQIDILRFHPRSSAFIGG